MTVRFNAPITPPPTTNTGLVGTSAPPSAPPSTRTAPAITAASNLPGLNATQANVSRQQVSNQGLLGSIKAGLASFKAALSSVFTRPPSPPPLQIPTSVSVTVNGQAVNIQKEQYEPMIMSLPKAQRQSAVATLQHTLDQRIQHGLTLLNDVKSGNTPPPPTAQDTADLALALYALAAKQGQAFTNGSFSVDDPHGRLAQWLDTSAEVYVRESSHLRAYQSTQIDGHMNIQRGIDIPEGVATGLPNGHRTVLFGSIPERTAADGTQVPRRLFLKTESAGCRLSFVRSKSMAPALAQNMRVRDTRPGDVSEFIRHSCSFLATRGQQGSTSARKEHFPTPVSDAFKNAKKALENLPEGERFLGLLNRGEPSKGGGVCLLRDNIANMRASIPNEHISPATRTAVIQILNQLEQSINANMPAESPDLQKVRLGNEVIIN